MSGQSLFFTGIPICSAISIAAARVIPRKEPASRGGCKARLNDKYIIPRTFRNFSFVVQHQRLKEPAFASILAKILFNNPFHCWRQAATFIRRVGTETVFNPFRKLFRVN